MAVKFAVRMEAHVLNVTRRLTTKKTIVAIESVTSGRNSCLRLMNVKTVLLIMGKIPMMIRNALNPSALISVKSEIKKEVIAPNVLHT